MRGEQGFRGVTLAALSAGATALATALAVAPAQAQVLVPPPTDPGVTEAPPAASEPAQPAPGAQTGRPTPGLPAEYAARSSPLQGNFRFDARLAWFPRLPTLRAAFPQDFIGSNYEAESGTIASPGRGQFVAVGAEVGLSISRRWTVPLVGFAIGGAVGGYPATKTSVDGVPFTIEPWTAGYVYMQAIGLEYRARSRRWMLEAGLRFGVGITWMKTRIAVGGEEYTGSAFGISPALKGDVAICRRLDPEQRLCGFVAPALYEFGLLNGASFGLRWEVGA